MCYFTGYHSVKEYVSSTKEILMHQKRQLEVTEGKRAKASRASGKFERDNEVLKGENRLFKEELEITRLEKTAATEEATAAAAIAHATIRDLRVCFCSFVF
jgi:hypothetical protein